MAVRLQMKLGVVAEIDRLPDSPDTITVVEPSIGSTARSKGSLYLLVTALSGKKVRDATRIVSETIRAEYYYDESAGISVCLKKAIRAANKRLLHSGERYGARRGEPGPVGLALAVVRGGELYVTTIGPAEAYLVRQARLLTLPDASLEDGLPHEDAAEPEVWHGEMAVGDSLVLVTPNVTRRLGLSPIQEAIVQLHPQAAIEQLHRQFASGGGTGSDGMLSIEATEVAATHKSRPLKPVWPNDSLAGTPDHSPIPLADTVSDGVAAVQSSARHVQHSAGGLARRSVYGLLDLMPRRSTPRGRVTPMVVRRERQRRLAIAVIGFLAVLTIVGSGLYALAGSRKEDGLDTQRKGQAAYNAVQNDLSQVYDQGDLLTTDKARAGDLLRDAYSQLQVALDNGYEASDLAPLRARIVAGLNRYYSVVYVNPKVVASFGTDNLGGVVLGPDGCAYVLDRTFDGGTIFRVDLATGEKKAVLAKGDQIPGGTVATPRLISAGGPDVLILDTNNALWRWRPVLGDKTGRGTPLRIRIDEATSWGSDVRAIGTYVTNADAGLFALYVVDPSAQQILKYSAAADGSGYPLAANKYLTVSQQVTDVDDLLIDGSLYVAERGAIRRFDGGQTTGGWSVKTPDDSLIRPGATAYTQIASATAKDEGLLYAYDGVHRRVVAFRKDSGAFVEQYLAPVGSSRLSALTGMFVLPGPGGDIVYWIESGDLVSAALNPTATGPTPSPSASPSASPKVTPKATKKR